MAARLKWRKPRLEAGIGQTWAPWVYALRGKSGSYLIRDANTRQVLYIGESHTNGRLFATLTRHLHQWSGHGAGVSYVNQRRRIEVAVIELPASEAEDEQFELIAKMRPRDNTQTGHSLRATNDEMAAAAAAVDEDIPF